VELSLDTKLAVLVLVAGAGKLKRFSPIFGRDTAPRNAARPLAVFDGGVNVTLMAY